MNDRFKVLKNNMTQDVLSDHYKEIMDQGNGYVLVYRNIKDNRYYCMQNGFTNEEGVYSAHLILKSIIDLQGN